MLDVDQPSHYADREFEVIDVIKDTMTEEQFKGYLTGSIVKYIMRWDKKENPEQDLAKAKWFIDRLIGEIGGD